MTAAARPKIEVTKIAGVFFVTIDGRLLRNPYSKDRALFSSAARARKAAKMAIARERQGFLV